MSKIKSMTAEQWAECYRMRQSIYDLCAIPADRELVTQAIEALYDNAERSAPQKIIFCKSPLEGLLFLSILKSDLSNNLRDNLSENLSENLWGNLWGNLGVNLWGNLWDNLSENLRDNLWGNLSENLRDNLWGNLSKNLRGNLRGNLGENLRGNLWDNLWGNLWGNLGVNLWGNLWDNLWGNLRGNLGDFHHFYYEKSFLGFALGGQIAGVQYSNQFQQYKLITENLDWIAPFGDLCVVCERPIKIGWHDSGGIHCEDGPAVEYADGYCLWAIEGYEVPEQVVMQPHLQTIEEINNEQNEEVKRIRINRYGWSRFISEAGASVTDIATPKYGGMESLMKCDNFTVLCTYDPSTGRPYALEADQSCVSCEEAQRHLLAPEIAFARHGVDVDAIETYPLIRA